MTKTKYFLFSLLSSRLESDFQWVNHSQSRPSTNTGQTVVPGLKRKDGDQGFRPVPVRLTLTTVEHRFN